MLDRIDVKYFKLAIGYEQIGKETDDDVSARCPICGDSAKNKSKKRLHLYKKGNLALVSCFNGGCPCQNKTMHSFLKTFYPELSGQYKRETFNTTIENYANGDVFSGFKRTEHSFNDPASTKKEVIAHDLTPYLDPIEKHPEALEYIKKRAIVYSEKKYGKWYYGYQDIKIGETVYKITGSIVIPLYYHNEMYGFYSRSTTDKRFSTYMVPHNMGYKVWNWFNVDKELPVFIFEGIFDAISSSVPNSIALLGAKIPQQRLDELKRPVFVLDNDKTGMMNSIYYANKGHQVFVQPDGYAKDMNENLLNGVDTASLILSNLHSGISATVRIKSKL
jgi:hypothetical protein